jgi:hypothetical protein
MKTTDQLAREIADREAIRDLVARYCDYVCRADLDGLVRLFTEDGTFKVEGLEVEAIARGQAQLKKLYAKAIAKLKTRLFILNHVVDLRGENRATGRCYVEVYSANFGMEWVGMGYYDDEYVKVGDEWKFAGRLYCMDAVDAGVSLRETFIA